VLPSTTQTGFHLIDAGNVEEIVALPDPSLVHVRRIEHDENGLPNKGYACESSLGAAVGRGHFETKAND